MDVTACDRVAATFSVFYRVPRAGAVRLSDGGGPLGFDITVALLLDDLVCRYSCDAIVETGCFLGDTTEYLASRYPELPVFACDIDARYASFTRHRLAGHGNATIECGDSPEMVSAVGSRYERPLFFLDAHWGAGWPLSRELDAIAAGVAVIHDFDIGHERFAYDTYDGVALGPQILAGMRIPPKVYFTPDPDAEWPLPCLQIGRRSGVGLAAIGIDSRPMESHLHLIKRPLEPAAS
ncbi:hypothetical protein Sme01_27110 [Sphaerisporangium melleum]|uniref:Uncharacterized protein n=1 Tax=Sphaerisporangium melleum TaxID=321316 RepID=A0A917QVY1_9ACTN|nr:hypothetical protein [Sphaerisporangium melleum]GGK71013.1 hypothetical protein GCM10007964_12230 [Sphaerisporangium melleum]GII70235.1 hypothetical protein Sme01_27110 [Sphaerisporangium melleum]